MQMQTTWPIPFRAILIACCSLMLAGCWHHEHSAYRTIHRCVIDGDLACVKADLDVRASDLELQDDLGQTPLHLAAVHCRTNIAEFLLKRGARLNALAAGRATPLHLAAQAGCSEIVSMLVAKGAEVNPRDSKGRTPLTRAKQFHQDAIVPLLSAHGGTE